MAIKRAAAAAAAAAPSKRARPSTATESTPVTPLLLSTSDTESDTGSVTSMLLSDHVASPSVPTSPIAGAAGDDFDDECWKDVTPFIGDECERSRFPLFSNQDAVTHTALTSPADDLTDAQQDELTFHQYLLYLFAHPEYKLQRRFLYSDQQYCILLNLMVKANKVQQFVASNSLDKRWSKWLYHSLSQDTFKWQLNEYRGETVSDIKKGPVLVCFKEPKISPATGNVIFVRRPSKSTTDFTKANMRRCVPCGQIEVVLAYLHMGGLGKSLHVGMDKMWERYNKLYDGITRDMVRRYVKKCPTCQLKPQRPTAPASCPSWPTSCTSECR